MWQCAKSLLITFLLASAAAWAQELYHASDPNLMARFSYERSPFGGPGIQQICMSVFQDGHYRMLLRYRMSSSTHGETGPMRQQGKMSKDQLQQLKNLLTAPVFRSLSGTHGGLIRDHAENFMAEISRIEISPSVQLIPSVRRLQWLNPDNESPFPEPIAKVIDWMKHFQSQNAWLFGDSDMVDVCPSVGLSLIQPSVAANPPYKNDRP